MKFDPGGGLRRALLALALLLAPVAQPALAQPATNAAPAAYPGVIRLAVDVSDVDRRIFRVRQTIPVRGPGRTTLLYPQWLPGNHSPTGELEKLSGLTITAAGRRLEWRRDPVNLYAFHVDVPAGATALEVEFQFLSPHDANQGGRIQVSAEMLDLQWQRVLLYPAGYAAKAITLEPSVRLPTGWAHAVALEPAVAVQPGGAVAFKPVTLETLIDSPLFAGRHHRTYDLDPGARAPVRLQVFGETPEAIEAKPEQVEAHRRLVRQADKLFGVRRFDRYDFLLGLTGRLTGIGLEHLRSSENITGPDYFTGDWSKGAGSRELLPHEYAHSWNGKHTRPRGLEQADYNTPVDARLLWVYEGLTDYWGTVLAARSGLITAEQARQAFAQIAATYDNRPGRSWRSVLDTTADPAIAYRRPKAWTSWQRGTDYYTEAAMVWLEADTLIRERSGGRRSLDDFARAFFGRPNAGPMPQLYDQADVVAALNAVQPYDWAGFFRERIEQAGAPSPTRGLQQGGYQLTYADSPATPEGEVTDLTYSLGFAARKDGTVAGVLWDGPAFRAGLTGGTRLLAVNGLAYEDTRLRAAVKAKGPVELVIRQGEQVRTVRLDASMGPRHPRLTRVAGTPARLDDILSSRP